MRYVNRAIQKVARGKWKEKVELERRFQAVGARYGSPAVRQYRCLIGAHSEWTYVKEWEYDDTNAFLEVNRKIMADPEYQALVAEDEEKGITIDQWNEVYLLLD